jgi:hypothetical protein
MKSGEPTERNKPSVWIMLLAISPIGAALIEMTLAKTRGIGADGKLDWIEIGARGDWWGGHFGAAAALTSAILFFYAVWLQHSELQETREEMRQARMVHESQKNLLEHQVAIAEKAAIRSHLLDIMKIRNPLLENFLDIVGVKTLIELNNMVEFEWYKFDELKAQVLFSPDGAIMARDFIKPLFRIDRYCRTLLNSELFNNQERKDQALILQLLPDQLIEDESFIKMD